jgi:tetratricopeptide (TPR) repeat protein
MGCRPLRPGPSAPKGGAALFRLGRSEDGIAVLDEFLETQPKNDTAWRGRAELLWNLGRLDEALQSIDRAVEFGPTRELNYYNRARIQSYRPGNCEAIRQDLEKIHELVLEDVGSQAMAAWWALVLAGPACPELADVETTVEITAKALDTDSQSFWNNLKHGSALYYAGRYEEARERLERAEQLDLHPNCNTLFHRAMVEHALGDAASARRYFDRAVARLAVTYPDNPEFNRYREQVAAMLE